MYRLTQPQRRDDRGFTLVELLIVIVILGILATVTVFAVRGITDKGQENAEGTDVDTLETAIDAYWMDEGSNPTEAELVSTGYLKEVSTLHDIVVAGDGSYTITNVRTGTTVGSGQASGPSPTTVPTAPSGDGWLGNPTTVGGVPAVSYGTTGQHVVFYGGEQARVIWNDLVSRDVGTTYNMTIVDTADLTSIEIIAAVQAAAGSNTFYYEEAGEIPPAFLPQPLHAYMQGQLGSLEVWGVETLAMWFSIG